MDNAANFRESRLGLLGFYASPAEQIEWQARTPTLGIDEPMEWWLEDFHPQSELFKSAFSPREIELLERFHSTFEDASQKWPAPPYPTMGVALREPLWLKVVEEARQLRSAFGLG